MIITNSALRALPHIQHALLEKLTNRIGGQKLMWTCLPTLNKRKEKVPGSYIKR